MSTTWIWYFGHDKKKLKIMNPNEATLLVEKILQTKGSLFQLDSVIHPIYPNSERKLSLISFTIYIINSV